jgi:hypothetical protein
MAQTLPLVSNQEDSMDNRNSQGLFDAPMQRTEAECRTFTAEEMERQFQQGAFDMDVNEAIEAGLINPYDDDTVRISIVKEAS